LGEVLFSSEPEMRKQTNLGSIFSFWDAVKQS
jgi:hypothetical protein